MFPAAAERVLSIQSHVVFGYVGGKAAVFPLQCMGYDVDVVNTVNFSNHNGYGRSGGTKTSAVELDAIFQSMEQNELMVPTRLLTGFIPGAEGLSAVANLARKLKKERPDLIYLLDPVMGDAGRLYVAADVIPVYRDMLPLVTVITPNWFEVEALTQLELKDLSSLRRALNILHDEYRVPNVVISSIPLKSWLFEVLPSSAQPSRDEEHLLCIASSSSTSSSSPSVVHIRCVPLIPGYFSGVGDLFSALLLAHFEPKSTTTTLELGFGRAAETETETPVSRAAAYALSKTHLILERTHEYASKLPAEERHATDDEADAREPLRKTRRMRGRELRLVQSQDVLRGKAVLVRPLLPWSGFWNVCNGVDTPCL